MQKKLFATIVLLILIVSLATPFVAATKPTLIRLETRLDNDPSLGDIQMNDRLNAASQKPSAKATVNIRSIQNLESVYKEVLIIAKVTGTFSSVVYQIDSTGTKVSMTKVGTTDKYQASWDTITATTGSHQIIVSAISSTGSVVSSSSVSVNVESTYKQEVYFEIDYVAGHKPSDDLLNYWKDYWMGHAIQVQFFVDDEVQDPNSNGIIDKGEFWALENTYNNIFIVDDRSFGGASPDYLLKEKWMLFGTSDSDANVGGYTYISLGGSDLLGGNYIFIADTMIDAWELRNSITGEGGDVIVAMHEAGHSIGITKLTYSFRYGAYIEVYDSDYYSIMSSMRLENAKWMQGSWYYSKEYWATSNLNYYLITTA